MRSYLGGLCSLVIFSLALPALAHEEERPPLSLPWKGPSGGLLAVSFSNGLWGGAYGQSLGVQVGAGQYVAFVLKGLALHGMDLEEYRLDLGGRLEIIGRSPILLNFVRLYGGGGVQVFRAITGVNEPTVAVGGGGHFGFEFFMSSIMAFFIEIGGQSGSQGGFAEGATVMAGMETYFL